MKTRLSLDVSTKDKKDLLKLTKAIGSPSMTQTILKALKLLSTVDANQSIGRQVLFRSQDGSEEVLTFL